MRGFKCTEKCNVYVKIVISLRALRLYNSFLVVDMRSIGTTICEGTDYANVSLTEMETFGREHGESGYEFLVDLQS